MAIQPSTDLGPYRPWSGFAPAADAAVRQLNRSVPGMDLWLATQVVDDRQVVVASAGAWAQLAERGATFSWQASLCAAMVDGGPSVACSVREVPVYDRLTSGPLARVRAYLGVPLVRADGALFGSLCAFAGSPRPQSLTDRLPEVVLVGRLLGSILAVEGSVLERSQEAAQAYALARRDAATGLLNHRGWLEALALEQERCARYGTRASVLAVRIRPGCCPSDDEDEDCLRAVARLVPSLAPACDVTARVERDELAVLSVETDLAAAEALAARFREQLDAAGLLADVGVASRDSGLSLDQTWARAVAMVRRPQPSP